jgi:hypothetical protein
VHHGPASTGTARPDRSWLGWVGAGIVLGVVGAVVALGVASSRGAQLFSRDAASPAETVRARDEPLPVPSASDVWIARAQAQFDRGHLHEALLALDGIRPGDPLSAQADRLKAAIQSKLLEAARGEPGAPVRPQDAPRP